MVTLQGPLLHQSQWATQPAQHKTYIIWIAISSQANRLIVKFAIILCGACLRGVVGKKGRKLLAGGVGMATASVEWQSSSYEVKVEVEPMENY